MTDTAGPTGGAGGLSGLLGGALGRGSIAETLLVWGFLNQLIQSLVAPVFQKLQQDVQALATFTPIGPPDLVTLVLRGWLPEDEAAQQAALAGLSAHDFHQLVQGTGEPPGLQTVMEWYRRGIVPWDGPPGTASVMEAIRTSRIPTAVWQDAIRHGNVVPIPAAEAVDAMVEGQIARGDRGAVLAAAEGGAGSGFGAAATTFYEVMWANGFTPDQADVMFDTRGNPPSPMELINLFRRGLIGWTGTGPAETTVQQGIYEGATKDKWEPIYKGLVRAVPSIYEVRQMLKVGALSQQQAAQDLADAGYTATTVAGVLNEATAVQAATDRKLTASVITTLYYDLAITRTEAVKLLQTIGFGPGAAAFAVEAQDIKRQSAALNSAITRVGTLYINHKLTAAEASQALAAYKVPASQAQQLVATWTIERAANVKVLTATEVVDAWEYGNIDQATAERYLVGLGYTPFTAWVLLSNKNKGPLGTPPPLGPAPLTTPQGGP